MTNFYYETNLKIAKNLDACNVNRRMGDITMISLVYVYAV